MDSFRVLAILASASAGVVALGIESRFLVPLLANTSNLPSPTSKSVVLVWHVVATGVLIAGPLRAGATVPAVCGGLVWAAFAFNGLGTLLFGYWNKSTTQQATLFLVWWGLQAVIAMAALVSRLRQSRHVGAVKPKRESRGA